MKITNFGFLITAIPKSESIRKSPVLSMNITQRTPKRPIAPIPKTRRAIKQAAKRAAKRAAKTAGQAKPGHNKIT